MKNKHKKSGTQLDYSGPKSLAFRHSNLENAFFLSDRIANNLYYEVTTDVREANTETQVIMALPKVHAFLLFFCPPYLRTLTTREGGTVKLQTFPLARIAVLSDIGTFFPARLPIRFPIYRNFRSHRLQQPKLPHTKQNDLLGYHTGGQRIER